MTPVEAVRIVARREVVERARQRSFLISTLLTVAVVVGVVVAGAVFGDRPTTYDVATVGPPGSPAASVGVALQEAARGDDVTLHLRPLPDEAAAAGQLRSGKADVALVGDRVVVRRQVPEGLRFLLPVVISRVSTTQALQRAGVDPATAEQVLAPPPPVVQTLEPVDPDRDTRRGIAYAGTIILYAQLIGYGIAVANGVVEEKSSRVIELLLATIRPRQLLTGKVLGVGLLALGQLLLVAVAGLGTGLLTGVISIPAAAFGVAAQVVLWFVVGFALFACLYAAAAATVTRQEDLQNATAPLNVALIASFFAAVSAFNSPDSVVTTVLSFVPPFSALVMPIRTAGGDVPLWQVALAVAISLLAVAALLRLAARIYANAVLRYGARVRWRHALAIPRG